MNILARYTLTYLWLNKKRTGVTILGVILSSALICGVLLLGVSFQQTMIDRAIGYTGNFHAMFQDVPVEKVAYIANHQKVDTAMVTARFTGLLAETKDRSKPYLYILAHDPQAMIDMPTELVSGRLPQAANEIAISKMLAAQAEDQYALGSQVHVTLGKRVRNGEPLPPYYNFFEPDEVFVEDHPATYTVVGILATSFEESIFDFPGYSALTYLAPGGDPGTDVVDIGVRMRNPYTIYGSVQEIVANAALTLYDGGSVTRNGVIVNYNDALLQWIGINDNSQYLLFFVTVLAFMIGLVVVGSGVVIFNAFSISISERKKQFGMFASTGATTRQIHQAVLFEAVVIGLAGIPLGITGGIIGVGITLSFAENIIRQVINVDAGMRLILSPLVIVLTIIFTGVTILLSAWIPARRAAKVSPIDAIRLSGDIQNTPPRRLFSSPLIRRMLGFEGELALKSVQRDSKRFRTTVISLMISIILFVTFNAMKDYSANTARLNNQADHFDLSVYLSGGMEENQRFINEVVRLPQVESYSHKRCLWGQSAITEDQLTPAAIAAYSELGWLSTADTEPDFSMEICTYGQPEFDRYAQSLGLDPQEFTSSAASDHLPVIVVNRNQIRKNKLYEFDLIDVRKGDTLPFASFPVTDEAGNVVEEPASIPLTIGAVAKTVPMGSNQPDQGLVVVVSESVFEQIAAGSGKETEDIGPGSLFFKTNDIITLTAELKKSYPAMVGQELFYTSQYEQNQREEMIEIVVNLFFYGFLTLITLVGVTNIVNTIDTNLQLRRREFAMLKSVGLTPGGFHKILRYESLFYGFTALLFGLPVSILLSALLYTYYSGMSSFSFTLPWVPMILCTAGVLMLVYITMSASGRRFDEERIIETIKEENL